jgi:hypothetical protein
MTEPTQLADLPAALESAKPGAIFSVALAGGAVATIVLSDIRSSAEPPE